METPDTHTHAQEETTDSKKVFQCGQCRRAYSRVDHLARHVRSHTREKPFRCDICSKGFSRSDLLKRHAAAHQRHYDEHGQHGIAGSDRASRVGKACKTCSSMHLRCDDDKPCIRCRKKNIECEPIDFEDDTTLSSVPQPSTPSLVGPIRSDVAAAEDLLRLSDKHMYTQPNYAQHNPAHQQPVLHHHSTLSQTSPMIQNTSLGPLDNFADSHAAGGDDLFNGMFPFAMGSDPWMNRSLFDFTEMETTFELNDMDFSFLDAYNTDVPFDYRTSMLTPPDISTNMLSPGADHATTAEPGAIRQSCVWRWKPGNQDSGRIQHQDLDLPTSIGKHQIPSLTGRKLPERLDAATRDKVLALIISSSNGEGWTYLPPWPKWLPAFPSVELLDALIQYCLSAPIVQCDLLFHFPTMSLRKMRPELVLALIAVGAVLAPDSALHKLGMALQEVIRQALPRAWESDNSTTRDLQLTQAYFLHLTIGLWSGNSRKTELAEAFTNPVITMLRRGNRFRRSHYPFPAVFTEDEGEILERKWKEYVEHESFRRLVYYAANYDALQSIVFWTQPLISYSELALPLPDSRDIWLATTAVSWKTAYLSKMATNAARRPSLLDCLSDVGLLTSFGQFIDERFATITALGGAWRLIWEYRQHCLIRPATKQSNSSLIMSFRVDELRNLLQDLRHFDGLTRQKSGLSQLDLELLSMHLHMSLDDVQLFAGIEGQEETRRVYSELQEWVKTQSAREALWHAGQIIRIAKGLPTASLVAFQAVAVYHASLAFWTYGLISESITTNRSSQHHADSLIWLDDVETTDKQRFIRHAIGKPAIRGLHDLENTYAPPPTALSQPCQVMDVIINVLQSNFQDSGVTRPLLVDNLIQLMSGLRSAVDRTGST